MAAIESSFICSGCGRRVPAGDRRPFRCPSARPGDDTDHVLRRELVVAEDGRERLAGLFLDPEPNPFVRYRELLHSHRAALEWGLSDADYRELVRELDGRVAEVAGVGFVETPFVASAALAGELGAAEVWIKDETGNVGGTHKGRHLAGVLISLLAEEQVWGPPAAGRPRLAIASCGNAAWAATLLARSVDWPIDLYVPTGANESALGRLSSGGAGLIRCERRPGQAGDPSYLRFSAAVERGSLPFTCQGPSNGLVIEGGQTLFWEVVSALLRDRRALDRMLIQTGGGAFAAAYVLGWREASQVRDIGPMPALHAVQTRGASPLVRAYDAFAERLASRRLGRAGGRPISPAERAELAAGIRAELERETIEEELRYAASNRSQFMWPWEEEPRSLADAILDDETYDWLPLLSGMLESGGYPIVVSEEQLAEAHRIGREYTGIDVGTTGSAGLAGALELAAQGLLGKQDRVGLVFSGVRWRATEEDS